MPIHFLMNYDTFCLLIITINSFVLGYTEKNLATTFEEANSNDSIVIKKIIVCIKLICSKSTDGKWATEPEIYGGLFYFIYTAVLKDNKKELIEFINQFSEFQFQREKNSEISGLDFMNSQDNMKKAYDIINKIITINIENMIDCKFVEYEKDKTEQVLKLTFRKE
jgi:hypothetical protein